MSGPALHPRVPHVLHMHWLVDECCVKMHACVYSDISVSRHVSFIVLCAPVSLPHVFCCMLHLFQATLMLLRTRRVEVVPCDRKV